MDNVDWMRIVEKVWDCPRALRGEMGFVDNVDYVKDKLRSYHIYCIYIQWCIYTLLSGANLDRGVHIAHIVHNSPTPKRHVYACGHCGQLANAWSTLSTLCSLIDSRQTCKLSMSVDMSTLSTLCEVSAN